MLIKIPVKPAVKKYIQYEYPGVFKASLGCHIGSYLIQLMRNPIDWEHYHDYVNENKYTETLEVQLSDTYLFGLGANRITDFTIHRFNLFIEELIRNEIYIMIVTTGKVNDSIMAYMEEHGMCEGDLSVEALRKMQQRKRKRKEKGKPFRYQFGAHHFLDEHPTPMATVTPIKKAG